MVNKNSMLRIIFVPVFVLLCACADEPEYSQALSPEQTKALELRAEERWQARIAHDWGAAWEYSSPAYREVFPKHLYVKKFSYTANWELTGVEVTNYDPSAAVASVVVGVMSKPTKLTSEAAREIGPMPRQLDERWILIDGEWWFGGNY